MVRLDTDGNVLPYDPAKPAWERLGRNFVAARRAQGLTQGLAAGAGLALASVAKIECGEPVMPTTLLAIEDGLDWPTGRSWDHLSRWGTEPLETEESLPPDLAAALRAEPRLDAEGQRLIATVRGVRQSTVGARRTRGAYG
jgi:transcriptional regulator with XRE-family HTH domain